MKNSTTGFYGKIPMTGDFIHRRINPTFLNRWDEWLKRNINQSQYTLGDNWLDIYLTSPMWRFMITPGIIDNKSYAGVMIPSVDSVGRYFPLTLVHQLPSDASPYILSEAANAWFHDLEDVLMDMLEGFHGDANAFDEALQHCNGQWMQEGINHCHIDIQQLSQSGKHLKLAVQNASSFNNSLTTLLFSSLLNSQTAFSLWWQTSSEGKESHCLYATGLPSEQQFTALFDDSWQEHGWQILDLAGPKKPESIDVKNNPALTSAAEESVLEANISNVFSSPPPSTERVIAEHNPDNIAETATNHDDDITLAPTAQEDSTSGNYGNKQFNPSYGITDTGNLREHNEDAMLLRPSSGLWVVADGMGGHHDGAYASQSVVEALSQLDMGGTLEQILERIKLALSQVNSELQYYAKDQSEHGICGSTVVGLVIRNNQCAFFWAGDSRLYVSRHNTLYQLSKDHSFEQQQIDEGIISVDDENGGGKNLITRAVGGDKTLDVDICYHQLQPGDQFLLCSDGVYNEISEVAIQQIFAQSESLELTGERIKQQILSGPSKDNFTAVLIKH